MEIGGPFKGFLENVLRAIPFAAEQVGKMRIISGSCPMSKRSSI
jgi:hypothetical protein